MGETIPPELPVQHCPECYEEMPESINAFVMGEGFEICSGTLYKSEAAPCYYFGVVPCALGGNTAIGVQFCVNENGTATVIAAPPIGAQCGGFSESGVFCESFGGISPGGCTYGVLA